MTQIHAVDYHTGGEPFRSSREVETLSGSSREVEPLSGTTVLDKRRDALERLDHSAASSRTDPRGRADM